MRKLYHATPYNNLYSILEHGINIGVGGVYMCETPNDAAKFLAVRGIKDILVVEVKIPKKLEYTISESFDHSYAFFKCRAFVSNIPIELNRLGNMTRYQI